MIPLHVVSLEPLGPGSPEGIASARLPRLVGDRLATLLTGSQYEQARQAVSLDVESMDAADIVPLMQDEAIWDNPWVSDGVFQRIGGFVADMTIGQRTLTQPEEEVIYSAYTKYGLSLDEGAETFEALLSYNDPRDPIELRARQRGKYVLGNLRRMHSAHQYNPYGVITLHKDFGIRHFMRYEPGLLEAQSRGEFGACPKVVLSAAGDWNGHMRYVGAGPNSSVSQVMGNLIESPIILEAQTAEEAFRRLVMVAQRYGPIRKLLINIHGAEDLVDFGKGYLTQKDVEQSAELEQMKEGNIFAENIQIILATCDAGKPEGFAQALAVKTGARVITTDDDMYKACASGPRRKVKFISSPAGARKRGAVEYRPGADGEINIRKTGKTKY